MGCINSVPTKQTASGEFDPVVMSPTSATAASGSSADSKMAVVMREKRAANKRRHDIFAESVSFEEPLEIVEIPKSDESKAIILQALQSNFLFSTIDNSDIELIRGVTFGELALVYNCPRQATIACAKAGRLWALDRVTFRRLVARNQMDQIGECKSALQKVELLKPLTDAQLVQLAEAAQIVTFKKGERIIKKGERGNVLYIIKKGTVDCTDMGDAVRGRESLRLSDNDYFGERALMTHEPRAANVTAATDVTLIALDRQAFDDLLGSLREVIDHNMSMRVLQSISLLKHLSATERHKLFMALERVEFKDGER
uniref:Cyclic nucleotide-binding domain-containing protein n=1 Tax=Globisporangium ultimum (strain ATCC 200006 / CBS 805.95 / DAOM BR144) TaxID=431595 RepID=K3WYS5_GLOUD